MEELSKNPDVDRLVGHSLGSSVVQEINNRHGNKYATTVYSSPFVSGINQQKNRDTYDLEIAEILWHCLMTRQ